jgi:hypothetical protein
LFKWFEFLNLKKITFEDFSTFYFLLGKNKEILNKQVYQSSKTESTTSPATTLTTSRKIEEIKTLFIPNISIKPFDQNVKSECNLTQLLLLGLVT